MAPLKMHDWRADLLPAYFRNGVEATFHVETGSMESGRRVALHEFPKKSQPYAEDMGKSAHQFSVRGYCICYPHDTREDLYMMDYRIARNKLIRVLEEEGSGILQLPSLTPMRVMCQRYRVTEEQKTGGYCTFDMQFVEQGVPPFEGATDNLADLRRASEAVRQRVMNAMLAAETESWRKAQELQKLRGTRPPLDPETRRRVDEYKKLRGTVRLQLEKRNLTPYRDLLQPLDAETVARIDAIHQKALEENGEIPPLSTYDRQQVELYKLVRGRSPAGMYAGRAQTETKYPDWVVMEARGTSRPTPPVYYGRPVLGREAWLGTQRPYGPIGSGALTEESETEKIKNY